MLSLREWLVDHDVWLDERLEITGPPLHVIAAASIPPHSTIAKIPKDLVLSHRTSSLARLLDIDNPFSQSLNSLSPPLLLTIHVLYEILLDRKSEWYTYLESCPKGEGEVGIGLLWEREGKATKWLRGTELEKEIDRIGVSRETLSHLFESLIVPLFSSLPASSSSPTISPTLSSFLRSYTLVSSRSFQVDTFHSLALVPFADAFDHSEPNHVHFASDVWVCQECGVLEECQHDEEIDGFDEIGKRRMNRTRRSSEGEGKVRKETCDMVTTEEPILPGQEIFNHYGYLSNARLIAEYGFKLEANDHDVVSFDVEELNILLDGRSARWEGGRLRDEVRHFEEHSTIASPTSSSTPSFHFDAEAKISYDLWLTVGMSTLSIRRDEDVDLPNVLARLDDLSNILSSLTLDDDDEQEYDESPTSISIETRARIERIATAVIKLCDRRLSKQLEPSLSGSQLLDLADIEPDSRTKVAIEFVAGERLLIEQVKSNWSLIVDLIKCDSQD